MTTEWRTRQLPIGIWGDATITEHQPDTPGGPRTYTTTIDPPDAQWIPVATNIVRTLADQANELERLRHAVWSDGEPWMETEDRGSYTKFCWFCEAETFDTHTTPAHTADCPWVSESTRRAKETHPTADN